MRRRRRTIYTPSLSEPRRSWVVQVRFSYYGYVRRGERRRDPLAARLDERCAEGA